MIYINNLLTKFRKTAKDEKGASMVEYALLVALIAVVCMVAVGTVGSNANTKFESVGTKLQ